MGIFKFYRVDAEANILESEWMQSQKIRLSPLLVHISASIISAASLHICSMQNKHIRSLQLPGGRNVNWLSHLLIMVYELFLFR